MKKVSILLLVLVVLFLALPVYAAGPYLACNPVSGATTYNVSGLPASIPATGIAKEATGTFGFKLDLSALPAGTYTVTAQACAVDANWGLVCSANSSPFAFTRPVAPAAPAGLGLVQ